MKRSPKIIARDEISAVLEGIDLISLIETGFVLYSQGQVEVPPVGEMLFPERRGELHIKYGRIKGDACHVIKIAHGFYDNPSRGLPSSDGMMLVFSQITGELLAILLDEGGLTNVRTAVAGAVAARRLAPPAITRIGLVGTGIQARLQAHWLKRVTSCREVLLWGRRSSAVADCARDLEEDGFRVQTADWADDVLAGCELVVTTTAATQPLLTASALHPRLHITAVGSDGPGKQELSTEILRRADWVVADSRQQARERGEIACAVRAGDLSPSRVIELGECLSDRSRLDRRPEDLTVADLTGVAVQDIQIAKAVIEALAPNVFVT